MKQRPTERQDLIGVCRIYTDIAWERGSVAESSVQNISSRRKTCGKRCKFHVSSFVDGINCQDIHRVIQPF